MRPWRLVAFYTSDNVYGRVYEERLGTSIKTLPNIDHKVYQVNSRGSWLGNIALKPEILQTALSENEKDILYVDSDAMIQSYPELIDSIPQEYDVAFHTLDHKTWYNAPGGRKEVFNGTLFLRNNSKVTAFVKEWLNACITIPRLGEHYHFERLITENKHGLRVFELPLSYAYIASLPSGKPPHVKVDNPVIVHYQASRKYRSIQL